MVRQLSVQGMCSQVLALKVQVSDLQEQVPEAQLSFSSREVCRCFGGDASCRQRAGGTLHKLAGRCIEGGGSKLLALGSAYTSVMPRLLLWSGRSRRIAQARGSRQKSLRCCKAPASRLAETVCTGGMASSVSSCLTVVCHRLLPAPAKAWPALQAKINSEVQLLRQEHDEEISSVFLPHWHCISPAEFLDVAGACWLKVPGGSVPSR